MSDILHNSTHAVCQYTDLWRIEPYLITVTSSPSVVSDMSGRKMTDLFTFLLLASWESWIFFWVKHSVNLSVGSLHGLLNCPRAPQGQILNVYSRKHNSDHLEKEIKGLKESNGNQLHKVSGRYSIFKLPGNYEVIWIIMLIIWYRKKSSFRIRFIEFLFYCLSFLQVLDFSIPFS